MCPYNANKYICLYICSYICVCVCAHTHYTYKQMKIRKNPRDLDSYCGEYLQKSLDFTEHLERESYSKILHLKVCVNSRTAVLQRYG